METLSIPGPFFLEHKIYIAVTALLKWIHGLYSFKLLAYNTLVDSNFGHSWYYVQMRNEEFTVPGTEGASMEKLQFPYQHILFSFFTDTITSS